MKSRLFLLAALLCFPAILLAEDQAAVPQAPAPAPKINLAKAPKIYCAYPKFDFKEVPEGPDITHNFHLLNNGKSNLTITNVATSCGCTAAVLKKAGAKKDEPANLPVDLAPGEKGTIHVTFHTQSRPGHNHKVITVSSNDPLKSALELQIDMTVVREIEARPERLYLPAQHFKEPHTSSVTILGKAGLPLKLLSAKSDKGVLTVTSVEPFKEESTQRVGGVVNLLLPETAPIGMLEDQILVKTDSLKKPELSIPVSGEVVGRVQYDPKTIYFQNRQESPVMIRLTVDSPKGFSVRGVKSEKHLTRAFVKKTTGPDGIDKFEVVANAVKNLPQDSDGKDRILVETNDKDQPQVSIDVQINR